MSGDELLSIIYGKWVQKETPMRSLVAIPVYNEQAYVQRVLEEVRRHAQDVLVIDDGSTDNTPLLLARQPVEVIRHVRNRGYGQSLIDAFRWAQYYGYEWLITMDCDEQHEPGNLPAFRHAARYDARRPDVVSGSRYLATTQCGDPPPPDRRSINTVITDMINRHLGLTITDAFCGFKAYRVEALKKLTLDVRGYAFPLQFWVQAVAMGLTIIETPVRLIYKDANRSFGGPLDDPAHRLVHYKRVFNAELAKFPEKSGELLCATYATGGPVDNFEDDPAASIVRSTR